MMRELTKEQLEVLNAGRNELLSGHDLDEIRPRTLASTAYRAGFIAGLEFQDARIAELEAKLAAYRAFVAGQITVDELRKVVEL